MEQKELITEPGIRLREYAFGDKAFYRRLIMIVLPMIIQNTLSNVVGLLDNIMVGQVGTLPMSAVAIINQLLFIYYICIWGGTSGAGIYGAQFFGKGDLKGVRYTVYIKMLIAGVVLIAGLTILGLFGADFANLYIAEGTSLADRELTIKLATEYLHIMMIGLIPFSIAQCYAGTMRESGKTLLPMVAGMTAMAVNFVFNLLLIFGLCGFPKLGVVGAAIATVISRFVEAGIIIIGGHLSAKTFPFLVGIYKNISIPGTLLREVMGKSAPLLLNEFLWALGEAFLLQCYSLRGIQAIAAMNICNTIAQLFNEVFLSVGHSAGILVGQELGANRLKDAVKTAWRVIVTSIICCFIMGVLLACFSFVIPNAYNTEPEIKALATALIIVSAIVMPLRGMTHASYFTLRSGGKTWITLIFDSCYSWLIVIPVAFVIGHYTQVPMIPFYAICASLEMVKCLIAGYLLKTGTWVKNIV